MRASRRPCPHFCVARSWCERATLLYLRRMTPNCELGFHQGAFAQTKPRGWLVDAGLLEKLLGGNRGWSPACTVSFDGDAAVKTPGPDNIMSGGMKSYAPRYATGRIEADSCYLLKEHRAMIVVQQAKYRDATGAEHIRQTLIVAD